MSALTGPRKITQMEGSPLPSRTDHKIKANVKVYQGALVVLNGGYAAPGTAATGLIPVGVAEKTVDNTGGSNGALTVNVLPGVFRFANSASRDEILATDEGKLCYIVDDQTVAKTDGSAARSIAGTVAKVDSAGVWVQMGLVPSVDGTALAAEIAAREALATDLAATTNGEGASMVGIEDAGSLFTGTDVEAALQEKLTGLRVANLADDAVVGGIPVVTVVAIADGVTADKDVVLTHKTEILDVVVVKTAGAGGASDTIQVKNGATAITNAIDINIADKAIARAGTIDDASNVIAAAGTLRITKTKASGANVACKVVVIGVRRA